MVTNATSVGASSAPGSVVYQAIFSSRVAKWAHGVSPGTSSTFEHGDYVIKRSGHAEALLFAPGAHYRSLSATVRASLRRGTPVGMGFGTFCLAWSGKVTIFFSFRTIRGRGWQIAQGTRNGGTIVLMHGASPALRMDQMTSVQGTCNVALDSKSVRLMLSLNGRHYATTTVAVPVLTAKWYTGIDVTSTTSAPTIVWARSFIVRSTALAGPTAKLS